MGPRTDCLRPWESLEKVKWPLGVVNTRYLRESSFTGTCVKPKRRSMLEKTLALPSC